MKNSDKKNNIQITEQCSTDPARRKFFKMGAVSGVAIAAGSVTSLAPVEQAKADSFSAFKPDKALGGDYRVTKAAEIKVDAAEQHYNETLSLGKQRDNRDERRYRDENFYASFSKCLPSNSYGEVEPAAFKKLRRAMRRGRAIDFANIELAAGAARRLENPQGGLRFEVSGLDSHATRIAPSFTFRSNTAAGQVGEVYWQALTRDVPFIDYDSSSLISDAVADMNIFSDTPGAVDGGGSINSQQLFRGETPGDLAGPYISQFLLRDVKYGPVEFEQRYQAPIAGVDFMTDVPNWLNVQRGGAPAETVNFDPVKRYINNSRVLSEYVHRDESYQAYLLAAAIILAMPGGDDKFDAGNPYFNGTVLNQTGFSSLGGPQVLDMVARVACIAFSGAWFQKFRVHRFLRPEAYGARIHFNLTGERNYEIHSEILNSDAVQRAYSANGTYLCPQAFIEGSPTHPSYPAGHACVAGACVTTLKAFFNEDFVIDDPIQSDAAGSSLIAYTGVDVLTIGGELNKLANNIALGRDAGGVHYRQDGIEGLKAGEQQAIAYLQDQSRCYNEEGFSGFTFTKFDGTTINIYKGEVSNV